MPGEIEREGVSYAVDTLAERCVTRETISSWFLSWGWMHLTRCPNGINGSVFWSFPMCWCLIAKARGWMIGRRPANGAWRSRRVDTPEELFAEDRGSIYVAEDFDYGLSINAGTRESAG